MTSPKAQAAPPVLKGAKYRFVVEGEVVSDPVAGRPVQVRADDGTVYTVGVGLAVAGAPPEHWPPQPGDVWLVNGALWVVWQELGGNVSMVPAAARRPFDPDPEFVLASHTNVTLKFRDGVTN